MDRRYFLCLGKACFALAIGCSILPVCHGQESSARKEVLKLNDVTGKVIVFAVPLTMTPDSKETKKLLATALKMAKEKDQPLNYNAAIILGRLAAESKDLVAAEVFYRIAMDKAAKLQSVTKLGESYGGLIDAFDESRKHADTARICKELLDLKTDDGKERKVLRAETNKATGATDYLESDLFDSASPLRPGVQRIYAQALSKMGKFEQALKLADELYKESAHWNELELKARILYDAGRNDEAAKFFEDVISQVTKDPDLSDKERDVFLQRYRYNLSSVLIDLNKVDEASAILQKLIDDNPKMPSYYNDLGYIWADKNIRLPEAEKLIKKALDLDRQQRKAKGVSDDEPENGSYLDSLAWVMFRQKRYKEAKEVILRALEDKSAQSLEVYDHLGDICQALGDTQDAVEAWRKGVESAGDSRRDQERKAAVEKKIAQNK
jgi:tetratricopeptide (TPR) repeat protein